MGELASYVRPVAELVGVIAGALALVAALVALLVAWLKRLANRGAFTSYQLLLALRILLGYQREGRPWLSRLVPVSTQNFIAMVGTAIGVWALIVVLSVMGGFEADLKGKIVRHSPHVTVRPARAPDDAAGWTRLAGRLGEVPHVTASEPLVDGEAMVTSPVNMSPGLALLGVVPGGALERTWLSNTADPDALRSLAEPVRLVPDRELGFRTRKGAAQAAADEGAVDSAMPAIPRGASSRGRVPPSILLGEELARSLSVSTGDDVTVVIPDGDVGPMGVKPRTRSFRVAGTFLSGMYEYDLKTAYLAAAEAQDLFLRDTPNRIALMLDDIGHLDEAAAAIQAALEPEGGGEVRTVAQMNRSLFSALQIEKIAMFLVLGLVILVAAFNVFGSLVLITMERTRDIAIVESLGATRGGIRTVFLSLGGVIGAVGTSAGLVLGLLTCLYVRLAGIRLPAEYYLRTLPVEVRPGEVAAVVAAALAAGLLATLYPATAAARLSPSEGLRND